jgi:predicted amidohydrolase YtcJ
MIAHAAILATALVIANGRALTMNPAQPEASAIAIVDGRIAYVGDDVKAARKAAGPGHDYVDAKGRTILPGFNDAHVHFGLSLTLGSDDGVDLPEGLTKAAFVREVKRAAGGVTDRFLYIKMRRLPDGICQARDLDFVARPLFVVSSHGGILNSAGVRRAGFTAEEAPDGFVRGRQLAAALDRLAKALPVGFLRERARLFLARLARLGITSVQLFDELPDLFEDLRRRGELTARVKMTPLGFRFDTRLYQPTWTATAPEWVRVEGVKYFHDDGARISRFEMQSIFDVNVPVGRPVIVHVLSRRALVTLLDSIEAMARAIGKPEAARLYRVEHADDVGPAEAARLARLGIVVCSNPSMLPEWRNEHAFPMRTLRDAGVRTCIGTDWVGAHVPPRAIDPFATVALAVGRRGAGGEQSKERITVAEALEAYTLGSAAAEGEARDKGSLERGKYGDVIVVDGDPLTAPLDRLAAMEVELTVVGGRVVHSSGELPIVRGPAPPTIGPEVARPPTISPPRPAPDAPPKKK